MSDINLDSILELAINCAKSAGIIIKDNIYKTKILSSKSSSVDLVTETDKKCEELVIDRIKSIYPDHIFIAEEAADGSNSYNIIDKPTWYIDPVDGTTNFVHGFPLTCISIGFAINKESVVGVVYNPVLNEMFTAVKGRGAFLDGQPIKTSSCTSLKSALVSVEFGYDRTEFGVDQMLSAIKSILLHRVQGLRSMGSCCLNMCYVAAGRLDLYYEGKSSKIGPKPWDMAAARLIVKEASGVTADPATGGTLDITSGRVLCSANQELLNEYLSVVKYMQEEVNDESKKSNL